MTTASPRSGTRRLIASSAACSPGSCSARSGAIVQALSGGRQDFASIRGLEAGRYDVLVDEPHAEAARMILRPALGR
jgi:hypothetical protein